MILNVNNLKDVLKKTTLNFSIETIQLKFGAGRIKSSVSSSDNNAIAILDLENRVIDTIDEVDFNFSEPAQSVIPFLNIFDEQLVDLKIYENRMTLKSGRQRTNIGFCSEIIINTFGADTMKTDLDWFFEFDVDEAFKENFKKIKKIGARFGNVYFEVKEGKVIIETSDKTNQYSNGLRFTMGNAESQDLVLCFDYKNMVNLMTVLEEREDFSISLVYKEEQELGMLYAKSENELEKYFLLSREI